MRDGEPVGGVARLEYENGGRVGFIVRSDGAHEVHVHGFNITKDVPADGSVRFDFPADIEGVFEVELEATRRQAANSFSESRCRLRGTRIRLEASVEGALTR